REPLSVGFGLIGTVATLRDGRRVAVKARSNESESEPSLALEGAMLTDLARLSDLPVPRVYEADANLLVMDFIDNDRGSITPSVEQDAATLIAQLHATPRPHFGYERDTLIGPLQQPNPFAKQWVPFFRDHRLLYMAKSARQEAALSEPLYSRLVRLAEKLDDLLTEPAHPSLLHGDLWTGNVLVKDGRVASFIDPAIYFGHPEIELAFTTMFGTFGRAFFDAYEDVLPLEPGFHDLRRDIYNLYPALVHVRLFGRSYLTGIEQTLAKLGL
ncbi:MAG: fructosamine kinase family protein, partial [Methyloceanibacter sp.]|nr:fructosamine kinase family protein [Methyloceanibacter sp.]